MENNNRINDIITHILFIVLAVLAIVFSLERLYVDSGYYLMRVVNHQGFWIEHHRMILVFPEWLPLLGVYLHLPLKVIILLYSVGHVLFFYLAYLICRYALQNKMAGYQLALIQVLGLIHGFFVPVFELYYGCGLLVIFLSLLLRDEVRFSLKIGSLLLLAFALMSHPMMFFLAGLIWVWDIIRLWKITKYHLSMIGILVGIFIFKSIVKSEYEAGKTQAFMNNLHSLSYSWDYTKNLVKFVTTRYPDILVLVILFTGLFVWARKNLLVFSFALGFLGLLILCNITYRDFDTTRYAEQVYFPLAACIIIAIPFLPYKLFSSKTLWLVRIFLITAFCFRIALIVDSGKQFSQRTQALAHLCVAAQKEDGSKFIIPEAPFDSLHPLSANWSVTLESLFISGLNPDLKTITICTDVDFEESVNQGRIPNPNQFLFRRWEMYDDSWLNPTYFKLATGEYQILSASQ